MCRGYSVSLLCNSPSLSFHAAFSIRSSNLKCSTDPAIPREIPKPAPACSEHGEIWLLNRSLRVINVFLVLFDPSQKGKGKGSSLDIAPFTILDSGALQPRKWQLTGIDCSTAVQASGCP